MVNYHLLVLQGREPVRTALIDLWADDGLTGAQRVRLLSHLCTDLRERDVHLVMALRCAMMPASAFAANLFLPTPAQFQMGAFFTGRPGSAAAAQDLEPRDDVNLWAEGPTKVCAMFDSAFDFNPREESSDGWPVTICLHVALLKNRKKL